MTNRDKLRKMSNSELAAILIWTGATDRCKFCTYTRERCLGKSCFESIKMWLNSPCADEPENPPADKHVDLQKVADEVTHDNVNHPAHYNRDGAMECIREMVVVFGYEATINFCKLNAWKYRYRASEKNGTEDMAKSDWYVKKVDELTAEGYL